MTNIAFFLFIFPVAKKFCASGQDAQQCGFPAHCWLDGSKSVPPAGKLEGRSVPLRNTRENAFWPKLRLVTKPR